MDRLLLLCLTALCGLVSNAQLLSWTPLFPKENDTVTIIVDASKGNKGLSGFTGDVYVHVGVITSASTSASDWKYVPFTWGATNPAALAIPAGANIWKYKISNIRDFFHVPTGEQIRKIAILFRSGDGSKKQANTDGTDMYVPVYDNTLAVRIDQPASEPKYTPILEPQNWTQGNAYYILANASKPSTLKLYHNGALVEGPINNAQVIYANVTIATEGNQQIIAEANDGSATRYDTINVFVAHPQTDSLPAGVRDGINYEPGDTSVILVLRAPGKNTVSVIGDFNNWKESTDYVMKKTSDNKFFWIRIHGLTSGTEYAYQYKVDGALKIADPYAEKILDPANDPYIPSSVYPNIKPYPAGQTGIVSVLQTRAPVYNWAPYHFTRPDQRGLVIYELLIRDFVAAHNWKTVKDSLNYLKKLGVNAIEIMPFNEFEGNDSWGYNTDFYFAPDKYYGPANTLREFVDSCHQNGIAVIMDIALNHSFGSSPMVQLYWDAANNRPAANNPWFNPVAKHAFNVGYDMNHESADTKYLFSRIIEHWVTKYQIDGFRFDLSKGFTQKQTCDDNGGNCNVADWSKYDSSRVTIWKGYYDTVQRKLPGAYVILEHLSENAEEKELAEYGMMPWGNMSYNYQEAAMGYVSNSDLSYGIYSSPSRSFSKPHLVTYMESHDEERITFKNESFGNSSGTYNIKDTTTALKRMELDAAFLLTVPGPKMMWQFGELGYDYSITSCHPGNTIPQPYPSDQCRLSDKPVRWDYLNDVRRKHIYNVYSRLIQLRFHPWYKGAFMTGTINQNVGGGVAVKWISVTTDTSKLFVVGNFDVVSQTGTVTFPAAGTWYDYLDSTTYTSTGTAQNITLQPGEFHVFVNRNVNNNSATAIADVPWNGGALNVKVFPNPVVGSYLLEVNTPQSGTTTVELFSAMGQYITTLYNGFLQKGTQQLSMKGLNVAKGSYYLRFTTRTATKTILITVQ